MFEQFIAWAKLKFILHTRNIPELVYFSEREIWWCSLGLNIGYEQNGKHDNFERPILILKKFNKDLLWVLPLTSQPKFSKFYYQIKYEGKSSFIILSQIRTISSRRLVRKIRRVSEEDFLQIRQQVKMFL